MTQVVEQHAKMKKELQAMKKRNDDLNANVDWLQEKMGYYQQREPNAVDRLEDVKAENAGLKGTIARMEREMQDKDSAHSQVMAKERELTLEVDKFLLINHGLNGRISQMEKDNKELRDVMEKSKEMMATMIGNFCKALSRSHQSPIAPSVQPSHQ